MADQPVSASNCQPDKCAGCPSKGSCGSSTESPDNRAIAEKLKNIGTIILVLSGKGGVGKSTVSTQLGFYLAENMEKNVGLMDVDICGPSIPTMTSSQGSEVHQSALGWEPISVLPNMAIISIGFMLEKLDDPVILRGPKKHGIISNFLKDVHWHFDSEKIEDNYLIIDTPPGTSDEHLSVINMLSAAMRVLSKEKETDSNVHTPKFFAVVVSTPQEVALADVRKEINFCKQIKVDVKGVIENMSGFVCPCCNKETQIFNPSSGGVKQLCADYKVKFLGRVPLDPQLTKASESGQAWKKAVEEGTVSKGMEMFYEVVKEILSE
ncbi:Nucleotide-binding protein 1 [Giardia lamblia P15]|uniref:Cytosolic Fe-S cluster assembly factor NUBP1 homolog n=1 Tax=Giardia intestinalis (strain P15) TaxID=658858 RepID=E1EY14_GIAIA|nr:Nucleotide-binding protein 1 [Giardia lamblia P15]